MKTAAFLVVLLAAATATPSSGQSRCHSGDRAALLAIKAALGDPYQLASWTPKSDYPCCDWYDVHCDPSTGRVVDLSFFQDANLTGTIPDAVAGLVHLDTLIWNNLPAISGPIPPAIAKLSNLSMLIISWTGVSGPVPSFLGALTKLTYLDLSYNSLTGTIPASLAALPKGSGINFIHNQLSGTLPPLLVSDYLWLSHNNLSGSIPAEFADVKFLHVDLSRNAFTGDASALFGRRKELQHLDLSHNAFRFNLSGVELPKKIYFMDVSHNAIYGGIPAQVANLSKLQYFNVSYNRLCGQVPTGGNTAIFDLSCYQHNKCLCGTPLPPCK
ncbi:polygalacturonase inhibitor-like [Phragmites australis]|uniref:polygalacturonase inhibitor-like n=1 Tax=Phragmites australis TaxID=29695 RepID=UPI002D7794D6|nr:polygalacturonase inhibitor-like [Phragmites australis]